MSTESIMSHKRCPTTINVHVDVHVKLYFEREGEALVPLNSSVVKGSPQRSRRARGTEPDCFPERSARHSWVRPQAWTEASFWGRNGHSVTKVLLSLPPKTGSNVTPLETAGYVLGGVFDFQTKNTIFEIWDGLQSNLEMHLKVLQAKRTGTIQLVISRGTLVYVAQCG